MKVNDPNVTGSSAGQVDGSGLDRVRQSELERRGGSNSHPSLSKAPDQVALSELGAALRSLSVDSADRVARLEKLSAEVATGRYQPNVESISRGLIDDALRQDER